ncbi:hypothetical protein [Pseudomonas mandelii]|uniref:hypothetical protein n=1 Tax=Pseudomonas mandelii TaxID=75612 RepID=UPI003F593846
MGTIIELSDLAACAMHRFTVVRDLTDTLSSLNLQGISDCDLQSRAGRQSGSWGALFYHFIICVELPASPPRHLQ